METADERCFHRARWIAGVLLALCLAAPVAGRAQARQFPAQARLGTVEIPAFPAARLDGSPVVLAPGVLIRNEQNALMLPQQFTGARLVLYRLDFLGQIRDIWLLDEREAARARAGEPMNDGKTAQ